MSAVGIFLRILLVRSQYQSVSDVVGMGCASRIARVCFVCCVGCQVMKLNVILPVVLKNFV